MAPFDLSGKVAIVTGSLGLLGREHSRALAAAGARVAGCDFSEDGAAEMRDELGERYLHVPTNITDAQSIRAALDRILALWGKVDVLVNNAALNDAIERADGVPLTFEAYPESSWRRELDVNVTGVFLCCQIFGGQLAARGQGSIVNVASTYGLVAPDPGLYRNEDGAIFHLKSPAYVASKAAVLSLTRYLAALWGARGVRVNALSPGGVENGQTPHFIERYADRTPLGRMATPKDYGGALVFLASPASAYMTGANLVVDGGWTAW